MEKKSLKQTKGKFKLAGLVNGTERQNFISSKTFDDSGKTKQSCVFGVKTSPLNETWVNVEGFDSDKATFTKWDRETKQSQKKEIDWLDRFNFKEKDFIPSFGVSLSFNGEYENVFPYDAPDTLEEELTDNMPVYVEGNINYSSYKNKKGTKIKRKDFRPTKIRKSKNDIDFESEKFKELNIFEQEIIFQSIEKHPEQKGRFLLTSYVVGYGDKIETVEFFIDNKKLAAQIKSKLKPYHMIKVLGRLVNGIVEEEEIDNEETWGDDDAEFKTVSTPIIREMIITKAYPSSIDKETYTQEIIDNVLKADESFGDDGWEDKDIDENEDIWE